MTQSYIGEIRIFAGNFPPAGWAFCDGQLIAIADNDTLYNLIGTTYGGDGQTTFGVPDLRGRVPVHIGTSGGQTYPIGLRAGAESVTVSSQQLPQHTHPLYAIGATGNSSTPTTSTMLSSQGPTGTPVSAFGPVTAPQITIASSSVTMDGGNQPHSNMQPYLGLNFIISLYGIYPTQS